MKVALFVTAVSSLMVASASAAAGRKVLDDVKTRNIRTKVLQDLEDVIDECQHDSERAEQE